jgi:hypothetical protein
MGLSSAYNQAGQFFGKAYGDMTSATNNQIRYGGPFMEEDQSDSQDDTSYMSGAVPPQTGTTPATESNTYNLESVKRQLIESAKNRQQNRPSNGHINIRAGGGSNPAIMS